MSLWQIGRRGAVVRSFGIWSGVLVVAALWLGLGSRVTYADGVLQFKCYNLAESGGAINEDVTLTTQFDTEEVQVKNPHFLCAPVTKVRCPNGKKDSCKEEAVDPDGPHLLCWKIAPSGPGVNQNVEVSDQFTPEGLEVKVQEGQLLCEQASKNQKN